MLASEEHGGVEVHANGDRPNVSGGFAAPTDDTKTRRDAPKQGPREHRENVAAHSKFKRPLSSLSKST